MWLKRFRWTGLVELFADNDSLYIYVMDGVLSLETDVPLSDRFVVVRRRRRSDATMMVDYYTILFIRAPDNQKRFL